MTGLLPSQLRKFWFLEISPSQRSDIKFVNEKYHHAEAVAEESVSQHAVGLCCLLEA